MMNEQTVITEQETTTKQKVMTAQEIMKREIEARAIKNGARFFKTTPSVLLKYCLGLGKLEEKGKTEIISLIANTELKMNKKAVDGSGAINPYWEQDIRKYTYLTGVIGFNYQKAVNGRREKEGKEADFIAESPQWGEMIAKAAKAHFVDGIVKLYIPVCCKDTICQYYADAQGNIIDKESLKPFLPIKKAEGARQGLENVLVYRTYTVTNIMYFTAKHLVLDLTK